jgi:RHS repeat-associated protein
VKARYDYQPFGPEILVPSNSPRYPVQGYGAALALRHKFTGKERHSEIGLDYFGARYFPGAQGRFTSPDPINVTPVRMLDPQRFNLYGYARNNPLRFVDPDGRDVDLANDSEAYRKKSLYSITKNLRVNEQRNIAYRRNKDGGYGMYVKDPTRIDLSTASEGYRQLFARITDHRVHVNYTTIPQGGKVQGPDGRPIFHSVLAQNGGMTSVLAGTGDADVFVAEGGGPAGVAGLTASGRDVGIAFPEYIVAAHELFGETIKVMPGSQNLQEDRVRDSIEAIDMENRIRDFHGLPRRSGKDHMNHPSGGIVIVVTPE